MRIDGRLFRERISRLECAVQRSGRSFAVAATRTSEANGRRWRTRILAVSLALASLGLVSLAPAPLLAQTGRIEDLALALRNAEDFRVRTQAALALGTANDVRAVEPLCSALSDDNTTVRAAAASAIGRLAKGGEKCLGERLQVEPNDDVKGVIRRAIERVRGSSGPPVSDGTCCYVAIGNVTNKTSRSDQAVDTEVRRHLQKHLSRQDGFALAPASETPDQVSEILKRYPKLKAVFVWPKLELGYAGSTLKLKLELSLFSYPDKAFIGSMSRRLAMPDTNSGDTVSENELIEMAAEQLIPDLARTISQL